MFPTLWRMLQLKIRGEDLNEHNDMDKEATFVLCHSFMGSF
jgi:hypothetical protein